MSLRVQHASPFLGMNVALFQDEERDGTQSNFFRFDNPEREDA
jgi:hypothetical protein